MRTLNINNNSSFDAPRQATPSLPDRSNSRTPKLPSSEPKTVRKLRPPPLKPTAGTTITATATKASAPTPTSRPRAPPASPRVASDSNSRASLGYKDQKHHVLALRTSRSTIGSASKMPAGDSRPRQPQPQLSAAAAKTVNRTPLTPKIASSKTGPPAAPLSRRSTYNLKSNSSSRDDITAPNTPHLAAATPRSGSRQSRVESANTTPLGTPSTEKPEDWGQRSGLGVSPGGNGGGRPGESSKDTPESKFFYASDARSQQPSTRPRPASVPQKPANFFHASKTSAQAKRTTSPPTSAPFTPNLATTPEPTSSKFFYANGAPDVSPKPSHQSGPRSTITSASRMVGSRRSSGSSNISTNTYSAQRPMSPMKTSQPSTPGLKGSAMPPGPLNRPQLASSSSLAPTAGTKLRRRVSIEVPPRIVRSHARTGSVPSVESLSTPRLPASPATAPSAPTSPPVSPALAQPTMTMASILQAADDLLEEEEDDDEDASSSSDVQSTTKSTSSKEPVNDLVANARRERKVQDLQITNASLEAINRTLERQLRKQSAEIRRYRRLTRSGRLSGVSAASSRVASGALSEPNDLSDLSEGEESMGSDEDNDSLDDSESATDSAGEDESQELGSTKIVARQKRDEKRLQVDLSKHQDILVDSQKINQSIKRCLNWTEVLIKEGQKALAYKVQIADEQFGFGNHVLAPPDENDDDVSQAEDTLKLDDNGLEPPWEKSPQDRDSGIELSAEAIKTLR